jgi:hypothetical protein
MPPRAPARVLAANIRARGRRVDRDPDRLSVGTRLQPGLCLAGPEHARAAAPMAGWTRQIPS